MIAVRAAEPDDVAALAELLDELDRFYGATESEPLDERIAGITDALFREPPAAYALLAWDGDELIGLATYSFLWPATGVTRSLYLKELYVREASRRGGTGRLLMNELQMIAAAYQCSRIEWTTEVDNVGARTFYAALGASTLEDKMLYRLGRVG